MKWYRTTKVFCWSSEGLRLAPSAKGGARGVVRHGQGVAEALHEHGAVEEETCRIGSDWQWHSDAQIGEQERQSNHSAAQSIA